MTLLEPAPRATTRQRQFLLVVGALVIVVVLLHQLWWSKPAAFAGAGASVSGSGTVGQPFTVDTGLTVPGDDVTLRSPEPVVGENSADAQIELVVCRYRSDDNRIGTARGSIASHCSSTRPVDGFHLRSHGDTADSILVRITPRKAGSVRVDGVKIGYTRSWRHAWQTGTQRASMDVGLRAE